MIRLLNDLNIFLLVLIFLSCLCRESTPFVAEGRHRLNSCSLLKNANIFSLKPLGVESNSEGEQQSSQNHPSFLLLRNTEASTAAWSSLHTPSAPAISTEHKNITALNRLRVLAILACAINIFLVVVLKSLRGSWRFFLAGGLCAAISHTIPTPIDVVKTRKQIDPRLVDKSFLETGQFIVNNEGFRALWAGLGPTTFGYLFEGAMKFGVYEVLKPTLRCGLTKIASMSSLLNFLESQFVTFSLSGIFSGLVASIVLCPMEVIRIRLVAEPDYTSGGWISGGLKIYKNEGLNGFTKGLIPMILKQVPYTVTKNVSFDLITRYFYSSLRHTGVQTISHGMKFTIPLISAAIASVLSSLISQPGDTILSLSCVHDGDYRTRDISRDILRSDRGISGFFVGTKTRLLHVGAIVTIQLVIYDFTKRLCGIAATGL